MAYVHGRSIKRRGGGGLSIELEHQLASLQHSLRDRIEKDLKRAAPKVTGQLERAIKVTGQSRTDGIALVVDIPVVQAATTEFGARPHLIRPRTKKVLRFEVGGKVVFTKLVHHPGNRPKPWIFPTLAKFSLMAQEEWNRL